MSISRANPIVKTEPSQVVADLDCCSSAAWDSGGGKAPSPRELKQMQVVRAIHLCGVHALALLPFGPYGRIQTFPPLLRPNPTSALYQLKQLSSRLQASS